MQVIVTGGNSGVGEATAAALAGAGHSVTIACRSVAKGERAAAGMTGDVAVRHLDLASLASVRDFAASIKTVDVLVNNAAVLGVPQSRTADGFECHMGTNHLGHFALTCLLGAKIRDRVVSVSSSMYRFGRVHLDDLDWQRRRYSCWAAYADSKLAVMMFVSELARRGMRAYAADPGMTDTEINREFEQKDFLRRYGQSPAKGARSVLTAVTTDQPSGTYFAPRFSQWGPPKVARIHRRARDPVLAGRLWDRSAQLTGCDRLQNPCDK